MTRAEDLLNPEFLVAQIIRHMGDDPERPGLKETPARVVRSWRELFSGYGQNPQDHIKVFDEPFSDEMVILRNFEFYSTCEHHLIPFVGWASIAYIPQHGRVIGISKLARLFDVFSRRLQIQERLTVQVTDALMESSLNPMGAACLVQAKHLCLCGRGVMKQDGMMVTSSLRGVFREKAEVRQEFFNATQN